MSAPGPETPPNGTDAVGATPLLELESVSRVYGEEVEVYALRDVSLKILPGEFMSIVGPSGSGKSTMLGLLGVLDLPTSGTIRIAGQDVSALDDPTRSRLRGDSIGFVFQQFQLIEECSGAENVLLPTRLPGAPPGGGRRAAQAIHRGGGHRVDAVLSRAGEPRRHHVGLEDHPFQKHPLYMQLIEDSP